MIATLIATLYLLGMIAAPQAATFLYISGALLIIGEIGLTTFGIMGFNGLLALYVGYAIQTGETVLFGLQVDWSLLFGIAFIEAFVIAACAWIIIKNRQRKVSTGVESMIGEKAAVVEWLGNEGSVRAQGETWKARSSKHMDLKRDEKVTISAVDGLTLVIEV